MTPADAQALQDNATARGTWLIWLVTHHDLEYPDRFVACVHTLDHHGGVYLPGALVAETLETLRAQLPAGLTRYNRTSLLPAEVIETWETLA